MTKILLLSHGKVAIEILDTLKMICGSTDNFYSLSFEQTSSTVDLYNSIKEMISSLSHKDNLIIIVDFKGGTPFNVAVKFKSDNIFILTGLSLAMVINIFFEVNSLSTLDLKNKIIEYGRSSIQEFSDLESFEEEF